MQHAVSLVSLIDGRLVVPPEAEAALAELKEPLTVAAFCGRYRGGKSSLLSRLLGSPDAFRVGHSVNACTKGIRFAAMPPAQGGQTKQKRVLLLDTEGLCATDSDATHDTRIFALSMLLSSSFFYNIVGTIDESALSTLRVVIDFASMMVGDDEEEGNGAACPLDAMREHMPAFHMLVRDMSLRLERPDGSLMTPDEWLESVLSPEGSPTSLANADDKASVRSTIKRLFAQRGCFTLPRPSGDEAVLAKMDSVEDGRLAPGFREGVAQLRRHLAEAPPKEVCGEAVTGPGLLAMARHLVERINSGATPRIRDAWALLAELRAKEAAEAALRHMHQVTSGWATSELSLEQLQRALGKASAEALEMCRGKLPGGGGDDNERVLRHLEEVQLPERVEEVMEAAKAHKGAACEATMAAHAERGQSLLHQLEACLANGAAEGPPSGLDGGPRDGLGGRPAAAREGEEEYLRWREALGVGGERHAGYPLETAAALGPPWRRRWSASGVWGEEATRAASRPSRPSSPPPRSSTGSSSARPRPRRTASGGGRRRAPAPGGRGPGGAREELRQRCERLQVECNQAVKETEALRGEAAEAKRRAEAAEQASLTEEEERATEAATRHLAETEQLRHRLAEAQHRAEALEVEAESLRERVSTEEARLSAALGETKRHAEGVIEERSREAQGRVEKAEAQASADRQQLQRAQREAQNATSRLSAQLEAAQAEASRLRASNEELKRGERQARLEERRVADDLRGEVKALQQGHQAALTQRESEWQRRLGEEQERAGALELRCARLDALNENGKREIDRNLDLVDENKRLRAANSEAVAVKTRSELAQEAMQERMASRSRDLEEARRQLQQERDRNLDLQCKLSVEQSKNGIGSVSRE